MNELFINLESSKGHVIAETACGHEGDVKKLKSLVDCVVDSGCKMIKFQIFKTHERAIKGHKEWDIFSKLELDEHEWKDQVTYAKDRGLYVFADIFGYESLSIATKIGVDGYKIHSEDLLNTGFIADICRLNKVVIIGVGGAKRIEIHNLMKHLTSFPTFCKIILMTGVQTFPTPIEAHSLQEIVDLKNKYSKYKVKVGFSDHVEGGKDEAISLPLMAFSAGADIVEKHITINRKDKWIDYHSALNCINFIKFIKQVNVLCPLLQSIKEMNSYEKSYRKMFKKSPAFSNNLDKGHLISFDDIRYMKDTENSIPVSSINLVNKKTSKSVSRGEIITNHALQNRVGAIIVARCGSSRLPNKALRKIDGIESIVRVIDRIKCCKNVEQIILATTQEEVDNQLVRIAEREGISFYRGSTNNVASRYFEAANNFNLNHFVRITGDAIFCDEEMIDKAIISHLQSSCDVTFMKNMPFGTHKEVVSLNAIEVIIETASNPDNTEYLEYFLENDRYFNINYVESNYKFNSKLRMTLDYKEDLLFFEKIYKHFNNGRSNFTLREVLKWLGDNEDVVMINAHKTQKTPANLQLDVTLGI